MRDVAWKFGVAMAVCLGGVAGAAADHDKNAVRFTVRIENIAPAGAIKTSTGAAADVVLAPGLAVVHTLPAPIFRAGELDRGQGLENAAEDGNPSVLAKALESMKSESKKMEAKDGDKKMADSGAMKDKGNKPGMMMVDRDLTAMTFSAHAGGGSGSLRPGQAYEFTIEAKPGCRLSFVSMFAQSNDCFYAPGDEGIALFDAKGKPVSGDVTAQIKLWDAGTEVNQEPGLGPDQGARQSGPNTGASDHAKVQPVNDGFTYPKVAESIRVTITPAKSE